MQPVLEDRIVVSGVAALAAIDIVRDIRSIPDGVAKGLQPAERGLFGIGLGEPGRHGLTGPACTVGLTGQQLAGQMMP